MGQVRESLSASSIVFNMKYLDILESRNWNPALPLPFSITFLTGGPWSVLSFVYYFMQTGNKKLT